LSGTLFFLEWKEKTIPMSETKSEPTYSKGTLYEINVKDLQADQSQPRKYFDPAAHQDLVNSLQKQGVLQPILFRTDQDGVLFIVAGERRVQAAKEAGLETIPAILVEGDYSEIALVENLLRQDLNAIEVAEALDRIMKEYGYNQEQLTGIIGKAKSTVSEILSLNRLPDEIKNECRNDPSTSRKALIAIAKKKRPKGMLTAYRKYKEQSLSANKPRRPKGKDKTWQEKFMFQYVALTNVMTDISFENLDVAARNELISRITELKKTAANLIIKIKAASVKKTIPPEVAVQAQGNPITKQPTASAPGPRRKKIATHDKPTTIMMDIN
jgi:ParB family transcriptional regulator, chromosome partitioning protein